LFTGIIEEIGKVQKIVKGRNKVELYIECKKVLQETKIGDSISVNGICLTVTNLGECWFCADVMPETISKTNFEKLTNNDNVNLERALMVNGRLGGHIVTGHIDGTGIIENIKKEENAIVFTIKASNDILKYIVNKGSVALDGTSLTVVTVNNQNFIVSIIPHTASKTIIGRKNIGDKINIECDILAKYVEKSLENKKNAHSITEQMLAENGFIDSVKTFMKTSETNP